MLFNIFIKKRGMRQYYLYCVNKFFIEQSTKIAEVFLQFKDQINMFKNMLFIKKTFGRI